MTKKKSKLTIKREFEIIDTLYNEKKIISFLCLFFIIVFLLIGSQINKTYRTKFELSPIDSLNFLNISKISLGVERFNSIKVFSFENFHKNFYLKLSAINNLSSYIKSSQYNESLIEYLNINEVTLDDFLNTNFSVSKKNRYSENIDNLLIDFKFPETIDGNQIIKNYILYLAETHIYDYTLALINNEKNEYKKRLVDYKENLEIAENIKLYENIVVSSLKNNIPSTMPSEIFYEGIDVIKTKINHIEKSLILIDKNARYFDIYNDNYSIIFENKQYSNLSYSWNIISKDFKTIKAKISYPIIFIFFGLFFGLIISYCYLWFRNKYYYHSNLKL